MKKEFTIKFRRPAFTWLLAKKLVSIAAYLALVVLAISIGIKIDNYSRAYDDTDWPELETRSGLSLYIDHGTGCHWIKGGFFGTIQPRLNNSGNQVCLRGDYRPSLEGV